MSIINRDDYHTSTKFYCFSIFEAGMNTISTGPLARGEEGQKGREAQDNQGQVPRFCRPDGIAANLRM